VVFSIEKARKELLPLEGEDGREGGREEGRQAALQKSEGVDESNRRNEESMRHAHNRSVRLEWQENKHKKKAHTEEKKRRQACVCAQDQQEEQERDEVEQKAPFYEIASRLLVHDVCRCVDGCCDCS
jgi:hypothetical protein